MSQLLEYIDQKRVLQDTNSGYRKGHSTTSVILRIRDDIIRAMKNGELTLITFADFSKAFDTVDHSIVIRELIRRKEVDNINSLTRRKHFRKMGNST